MGHHAHLGRGQGPGAGARLVAGPRRGAGQRGRGARRRPDRCAAFSTPSTRTAASSSEAVMAPSRQSPPATSISAPSLRWPPEPRDGEGGRHRTRLLPAWRGGRDRHELRPLRLRAAGRARVDHRRCRRDLPRPEPAGRRPGAARHPLHRGGSRPAARHRHHPRARGPLRRAAGAVAAAEGAGVDDAVRRRAAGGQAPVRERRDQGAGHHLSPRRLLHRRPLRHRDRAGQPLDSRAGGALDHHAARHPHPHRRLEDRPGARNRSADRRGPLPRDRRRGRARHDVRFHQRHARGRFAVGARCRRGSARA